MRAAAFGFGVSADHALDPVPDLDLQPLAAAAFFVKTGALLGDDPLQSLLPRHLKQRLAALLVVIGIAHASPATSNDASLRLRSSSGTRRQS